MHKHSRHVLNNEILICDKEIYGSHAGILLSNHTTWRDTSHQSLSLSLQYYKSGLHATKTACIPCKCNLTIAYF